MSEIKITTLQNGLRVGSVAMKDVESIALGVWVNVGARYEQPHEHGVAHFLEHMSFKGTSSRSALDIAQAVENVGGHMNAYTGFETTAYFVRLLHQNLALGCDILFDVLRHSTFCKEEIEKERGVILQEIGRNHDSPDSLVFDHFQRTAFQEQPLGCPILGTLDSVKSMNKEHFHQFMDTHYKPSNMLVIASGKIHHDDLVSMVEEKMGNIADHTTPTCAKAHYTGGDHREERDTQQIHLVLGFPSSSRSSPDHWSYAILAQILGGGMASRLFQEIREKRGLVYAVGAHHSAYQDIGDFSVYAGTGPDLIQELIPTLGDEICKIAHDIQADEIERARQQFKAGMLMGQESVFARAQKLASQLFLYGKPRSMDEIMSEINAVDHAAIKRVCEKMLSHKPTVAAIGPLANLESPDKIQSRFVA